MKLTTLLTGTAPLGVLVAGALFVTNPSSSDYQRVILNAVAEREAQRLAAVDRAAVDKEASVLASHLAAVRYEGRRLDRVAIERRYPLLGPALIRTSDAGSTLTHGLAQAKEQALHRITVTEQTFLYRTLADLASHTTRTSYGLWSVYATCFEKIALAYVGIADQFYASAEVPCLPPANL